MNFCDLHSLTAALLHLLQWLNGLQFKALKTYYCYLCGTIGTSLLLLTFLPQRVFTLNKTHYARGYLEHCWLVEDGGDSR